MKFPAKKKTCSTPFVLDEAEMYVEKLFPEYERVKIILHDSSQDARSMTAGEGSLASRLRSSQTANMGEALVECVTENIQDRHLETFVVIALSDK